MNWRLIFLVSGLIVIWDIFYFSNSQVQLIKILHIIMFFLCTVLIAKKAPRNHYLHGFIAGLISAAIEVALLFAILPINITRHIVIAEFIRQAIGTEGLLLIALFISCAVIIKSFLLGVLSLLFVKLTLKGLKGFFSDQFPFKTL